MFQRKAGFHLVRCFGSEVLENQQNSHVHNKVTITKKNAMHL